MQRHFRSLIVLVAAIALLTSCGLRRKKYENPITKDTRQPDKVLFDKAINDVEHSRYEVARLTLQTLINTYDTSEYLAKAKLAIADSWYREGGTHGLAQAEAEYKDFRLFYPNMEEAAEAQNKVCDIHYKQMEKADRDSMHAMRAEDECRELLQAYPNSKFAPIAAQKLRNIQEVLATKEFKNGNVYYKKGSYPAAAHRFQDLTDQYPLFSGADEALWLLGDAYTHMGDRMEDRAGQAYSRIVKEYPLSDHVEDAKARLKALNKPVPEADPAAYARMKYELENREKVGMMGKFWDVFKKSPNTSAAAKSGTPTMTAMRPTVPVSVPVQAATEGTGQPTGTGATGAEVTAGVSSNTGDLANKPDARQNPPAAGQAPGTPAPAAPAATGTTDNNAAAQSAQQPLPTNHPMNNKKQKKPKEKKPKKGQPQPAATSPSTTDTAAPKK